VEVVDEAVITGPHTQNRERPDTAPVEPGWLARQVLALFAEANRRRRRRRLGIAAALLGAAVVAAGALIGYRAAGHRGHEAARLASHAPGQTPRFRLPAAVVAWFDADGTLRIGNVATLAQRPVAQLSQEPCCTLIAAGHGIYWAGQHRGRGYIQEYNLSTHAIRDVAPGWAVFASASRRNLYIAQSDTRLLVLPDGGSGPARRLVTPPGWRVVPLPYAVAGGIIVSTGTRRPAIGLWRPGAHKIWVVGHGYVMTTWTQPSGRAGLIAWWSGACRQLPCPMQITNTVARRTVTVRPPPGFGFIGQGGDAAFSPDGRTLAVFVNPLHQHPYAGFVPILVDTATGGMRLVRRALMTSGELAGWLLWLPGSGRLLAGPAANTSFPAYAIDASTAAARPFTFFVTYHYPESSVYDITDGNVLLGRASVTPRRLTLPRVVR
jgi:hypothetical protein